MKPLVGILPTRVSVLVSITVTAPICGLATYACLPALARPVCGRLCEGIYLAGDYTYGAFPATLEAAVRSGQIAARALARDRPAEHLASGA